VLILVRSPASLVLQKSRFFEIAQQFTIFRVFPVSFCVLLFLIAPFMLSFCIYLGHMLVHLCLSVLLTVSPIHPLSVCTVRPTFELIKWWWWWWWWWWFVFVLKQSGGSRSSAVKARKADGKADVAKQLAAEKMATAAVRALDEQELHGTFYDLIYSSLRGALTPDAGRSTAAAAANCAAPSDDDVTAKQRKSWLTMQHRANSSASSTAADLKEHHRTQTNSLTTYRYCSQQRSTNCAKFAQP